MKKYFAALWAKLVAKLVGDTPLIYTLKGNLPIEVLEYSHKWEERDTCHVFSEIYTLDGEIVKESAHVLMKTGLAIGSEQEQF